MTYVADLHTHSPFARGTSPQLTFENMARWAKIKGIDMLASGDFTHPAWFDETRDKLNPIDDGTFEYEGTRFVLGTEVNCNSRQDGRSRRIHMLIFAPGLEAAERINTRLASHGKLRSDGRPTLHMSPRELLETLLDVDHRCFVIPAHLWTPWFGLYGSKSGFDSLEEAFGDLTGKVHAVETGLSSEPAMNWRVPSLDGASLVSFSDAHSLPNLGRELTVFDGEPTYDGLANALETQSIAHTIEFFPEEGKYHYSGHRNCGVRLSSDEIDENGPTCPVCGRNMTLGVLQRVDQLGGREFETHVDSEGFTRGSNGRPPFKMLVGLRQIIAEALDVGPNTKKVQRAYFSLTSWFGSELDVLMDATIADVASVAGDRVAEGVDRVRRADLSIEPGYDGVYGTVKIWPD